MNLPIYFKLSNKSRLIKEQKLNHEHNRFSFENHHNIMNITPNFMRHVLKVLYHILELRLIALIY